MPGYRESPHDRRCGPRHAVPNGRLDGPGQRCNVAPSDDLRAEGVLTVLHAPSRWQAAEVLRSAVSVAGVGLGAPAGCAEGRFSGWVRRMTSRVPLQVLHPTTPPEPPPDRGRLLTPQQVADVLFNGTVSAAWVRRHVPYKVVLGHSTIRWYEHDVRRWIDERRGGVAFRP